MGMLVKRFGTRIEEVSYTVRVGVYALIFDETRENLMIVSPPNGTYLLPGGEIETGETKEETLHREVMEELGFTVSIGTYLGEAEDFYYSTFRKKHYHNPGYFYVVESYQKVSEPLEDFNKLYWLPIKEAHRLLKRGSHKWAIETYLAQHGLSIH